MTAEESVSEIRKRAWQTRRAKYGTRGHSGAYRCGTHSIEDMRTIATMRNALTRLHIEGVLSEGQAAKVMNVSRLEVRKMADLINNMEAPAR